MENHHVCSKIIFKQAMFDYQTESTNSNPDKQMFKNKAKIDHYFLLLDIALFYLFEG